MNEQSIKALATAVIWQAVKDFFRVSEKKQAVILKDLRSDWMDMFTDGVSVVIAEQLEKHPDEIKARLPKYNSEEEE